MHQQPLNIFISFNDSNFLSVLFVLLPVTLFFFKVSTWNFGGRTLSSLPQCVVPPPSEAFLQSVMWATVTRTSLSLTADKELLQRVKVQESIGGDTLPVREQSIGSTLLSAAFNADCILHRINFTGRNMVWKWIRCFYTRWNISVIDASTFSEIATIFEWVVCSISAR